MEAKEGDSPREGESQTSLVNFGGVRAVQEQVAAFRRFKRSNALLLHPRPAALKQEGRSRAYCLILGLSRFRQPPVFSVGKGQSLRLKWRLSLFDRATKAFFGRTWQSATSIGLRNASKVAKGTVETIGPMPVYFHSRITSDEVSVVVEAVAAVEDDETGALVSRPFGIGWTMLNVFGRAAQALHIGDLSAEDAAAMSTVIGSSPSFGRAVDVMSGTPQALAVCNDTSKLVRVSGAQLRYQLYRHTAGSVLTQLLPENVLVGPLDVVPGLRPVPAPIRIKDAMMLEDAHTVLLSRESEEVRARRLRRVPRWGGAPPPPPGFANRPCLWPGEPSSGIPPLLPQPAVSAPAMRLNVKDLVVYLPPHWEGRLLAVVARSHATVLGAVEAASATLASTDLASMFGMRIVSRRLVLTIDNGLRALEEVSLPLQRPPGGSPLSKTGSLSPSDSSMLVSGLTSGVGGMDVEKEGECVALDSFRLDPMVVLRMHLEYSITHPPPPVAGLPAIVGMDGTTDLEVRRITVGVQEFPPFDGHRLYLSNTPGTWEASVTGRPLEVPLRGAVTRPKVKGVWFHDSAEFAEEMEDPVHRVRTEYSPASNVFVGMRLEAGRIAGAMGSGTQVVYIGDGGKGDDTLLAEGPSPEDEAEAQRLRQEAAAAEARAEAQRIALQKAMEDLERTKREATEQGTDTAKEMEERMKKLLDEQQKQREQESERMTRERKEADERWRKRLQEAKDAAEEQARVAREEAKRRQRELEERLKEVEEQAREAERRAHDSRNGSASHITTPRDVPPTPPSKAEEPKPPAVEEAPKPPPKDDKPIAEVEEKPSATGSVAITIARPFTPPSKPHKPIVLGRVEPTQPGAAEAASPYWKLRDMLGFCVPLTRAERALLAAHGYSGTSDTFADETDSIELDLSDQHTASCVHLRLAAIVPTAGGLLDRAVRGAEDAPRRSVYFTFQFYSCPPTRTSALSMVACSDDSGSGTVAEQGVSRTERQARKTAVGDMVEVVVPAEAPPSKQNTMLLMSSGTTTLAPTFEYDVDPTASHPGDGERFIRYLGEHRLQIEVWDGLSHLPLGVAMLDLRPLLRRQQPFVSAARALDIVSLSPTSPDPQPMAIGNERVVPRGASGETSPWFAPGHPGTRVGTLQVLLSSRGYPGSGVFETKDLSGHAVMAQTMSAGRAASLKDGSAWVTRKDMRKTKVTVEAKRLRAGASRDLEDLLRTVGAGRKVVEEVVDTPLWEKPRAMKAASSSGALSDPGCLSLRETHALRRQLSGGPREMIDIEAFLDLVYGRPEDVPKRATSQGTASGASVGFWQSEASDGVDDSIPSRRGDVVDSLLCAALRAMVSGRRDGVGAEDSKVFGVFEKAARYAEGKREAVQRYLDDKAVAADARREQTLSAYERAKALVPVMEPLQASTAFTVAEASVECAANEMTAGRFRHTLAVRAGVHLTDREFSELLERHQSARDTTSLSVVKFESLVTSILKAGDASDMEAVRTLRERSTDHPESSAALLVSCGKIRSLVRLCLSSSTSTLGERGSLRAALKEVDEGGRGSIHVQEWRRVMERRLGLRVVLDAGEDPFDSEVAERQLERAMAIERSLSGLDDSQPRRKAEGASDATERAAAIRSMALGAQAAVADPELALLQLYREGRKRDLVNAVLAKTSTFECDLYPSCGRACLLQLTVQNPYPHEERLQVFVEDPSGAAEMRLITDAQEWGFLRQVLPLEAPDPAQALIDAGLSTGTVQAGVVTSSGNVLLAPFEAVTLGFVFLSFSPGIVRSPASARAVPVSDADATARATSRALALRAGRAPSTAAFVEVEREASESHSQPLSDRCIQVRVASMSHGTPVAVLKAQVHPRPFPIHRTVRFFHTENSTLRAVLSLPSHGDHAPMGQAIVPGTQSVVRGDTARESSVLRQSFNGAALDSLWLAAPGQFVFCPDSRVICESVSTPEGRQLSLRLRAGAFPSTTEFLVHLFNDPYCASLHQTWRVVVHSVLRCDVSCMLNDTAEMELVVRSDGRARRVRIMTSLPSELWSPMLPPVTLTGGAYNRIRLAYTPKVVGQHHALVHVTDVDDQSLLCAWQVCATASAPTVHKAYDIAVPHGAGEPLGKKLAYTNGYPEKRTFHVRTDRPDLVEVRDRELTLEGGGAHGFIRLGFTRKTERGTAEALVFVEDDRGVSDEVLLLRVSWI
jgi:hypothetical protein